MALLKTQKYCRLKEGMEEIFEKKLSFSIVDFLSSLPLSANHFNGCQILIQIMVFLTKLAFLRLLKVTAGHSSGLCFKHHTIVMTIVMSDACTINIIKEHN